MAGKGMPRRDFSAEVFRQGIDIEAPIGEVIRAGGKGERHICGIVLSATVKCWSLIMGSDTLVSMRIYLKFMKMAVLGSVGDSHSLVGARLYFRCP